MTPSSFVRSMTATVLPRLTVLRSGEGTACAHEARPMPGRWRPVGALQAIDVDHDAVVELEQSQPPEPDLGQHTRGGGILDPAASDQLVEAATTEGLVATRDRRLRGDALPPAVGSHEVADLDVVVARALAGPDERQL